MNRLPSLNPREQRAFTIVEALIVIALTAVLLVLLAQATRQFTGEAQKASCVNRLRQIGIATRLHINDNRERWLLYRLVPASPGRSAEETLWMDTVRPYGITADDTLCPAMKPIQKSRYIAYGRRSVDDFAKTLLENNYAGTADGGEIWLDVKRIEQPHLYPLIGDTVLDPSGSSGVRAGQQCYSFRLDGKQSGTGIHLRHSGSANILFADGRVESCAPLRLKEMKVVSGFNAEKRAVTW